MRLRQIFGDDLHPALRPVVAVTFVGSIAGSALWTFAGIWALRRLHAGETRLAWAFVVGAILAATAGYVGGHLSDDIGRRPLILAGWLGETVLAFSLLLVGGHVWLGLGLFTLAGFFGSVGGAAEQAMVADLVPPDWHERGYATMRVASNWARRSVPSSAACSCWWGAGPRSSPGGIDRRGGLPSRRPVHPGAGRTRPGGTAPRGSWAVISLTGRSSRFRRGPPVLDGVPRLRDAAPDLARPAARPAAVDLGLPGHRQPGAGHALPALRLTRRVERYSPVSRLVLAMLLMGPPFLLLGVSSAVPLVVALLVVFVIGEMLWIPTSQGVVAALAPETFGAPTWGHSALPSRSASPWHHSSGCSAPRYGDTAMWAADAGVALAAAALYAVALRASTRAEHLARAGAL